MKISELIVKLEEIKDRDGDLPVCVSTQHEYWGTLEDSLEVWNMEVSDHAQPKGPKSGESVRALVLGR